MRQGLEIRAVGGMTFYFFKRDMEVRLFSEKFRLISVIIEIPILASTAARAKRNKEKGR
jgi:hypothetical protein